MATLEQIVEKFDLDAKAVGEVMGLFIWASGRETITINRLSEILMEWGLISKPLTMEGNVSLRNHLMEEPMKEAGFNAGWVLIYT